MESTASSEQMPDTPLTIALFASTADPQAKALGEALEDLHQEVKTISAISDLRYLEDVQFCTFEAILFSPHFGNSIDEQLALIREIRSEPDLIDMPLVVLSGGARSRFHSSLYDCGADVVMPDFTPPNDLVLLLRNLLEKRNEKRGLLEGAKFTMDSELQILYSLSICPQPIVALTPNMEVRWLNPQAENVLGLQRANEQSKIQYLTYLAGVFKNAEALSQQQGAQPQPVAIETFDGVNDWWDVEAWPYSSAEGQLRGFVVRFTPQIKRRLTHKRVSQITQLESMALLTASCAHQTMQKTQSGIVVGPYRQIEKYLDEHPRSVNLNSVVTSLLEYLDPVIDPELSIRVSIPAESLVSLSFGDCFQLVGHMLFTAIGFVCGKGEIMIECKEHDPGNGTILTMTAQSITRARMLALLDDESIEEELHYTSPDHSEEGLQLASRFDRIRELTGTYRTELQFQTKGDELLKLRVALPSKVKEHPPA